MTTDDTRRRPLEGTVDFTFMYAVHGAFRRDLRRLAAAVEAAQTADTAVRTGWATFKNQLHVHHTAEDDFLWPPLRAKVTQPGDVAVLDAMQAEHARLGPLLSQVDASLAAAGCAGLADNASMLTAGLAAHMDHEEDDALPLVETHLGPGGWAAFRKAAGKSQGLKGGAELFPWMLDGAPAGTSKRVLKAARGTYRTAIDRNLPHCFSISRADLAACMLALLDDPAAVHRHVCIAN